MDEPWENYAKWKNSHTKDHILYEPVYMKYPYCLQDTVLSALCVMTPFTQFTNSFFDGAVKGKYTDTETRGWEGIYPPIIPIVGDC